MNVTNYRKELESIDDKKNELSVQSKPPMKNMISKLSENKISGVDLYKTYGNLTVSKIIKEKPPSLVYYKKTENVDKLRKDVARFLIYLCSWFDSSVTNMHAVDISEKILSTQKLNHLTFEDLYIMGEQFKNQKVFGKLTPAVLLQSITQYAEYKLQQVQAYNKEMHLRTKDDPTLSERWRSRGHVGHSEENIIKKVEGRYKWNQKRE